MLTGLNVGEAAATGLKVGESVPGFVALLVPPEYVGVGVDVGTTDGATTSFAEGCDSPPHLSIVGAELNAEGVGAEVPKT